MLEADLFSYLADPAGEVYGAVADRIYPLRLLEGTDLPAMAYQRISTTRSYTHDNAGGVGTVPVRPRIQFACWAHTALEAFALGETLISALSGFQGTMGGTHVDAAFVELELDSYEAQTGFYRRLVDVMFLHAESIEPVGS